MKIKLIISALALVILNSCSKAEDPLEKEKKLIDAYIAENNILVPYKGVKIALRTDYSNPSAVSKQVGEETTETLKQVSGFLLNSQDSKQISLMDAYNAYKGFNNLKENVSKIEEDELPTILNKLEQIEKATGSNTSIASSAVTATLGEYNSNTEHFLLSAVWFVVPSAPRDFYIYETTKIDPSKINKPDVQMLSYLIKAFACQEKEWYYTSEYNTTGYINYLTNNKKAIIAATSYLDSTNTGDGEQRINEFLSVGYALRGYSKLKSDRKDEAVKDFDLCVQEIEKSGVSNNSVDLLACSICIYNDEFDKANSFVSKIEKRGNLSKDEQASLSELKGFIKNKDGEKFSKFFDSISLTKIAYHYFEGASSHTQIMDNQNTKTIVELPKKVNSLLTEPQNLLNTDSIASKAKDLLNGLFK